MPNYIPVIAINGQQLAPCHPSRANSLVNSGKAQYVRLKGQRKLMLNRKFDQPHHGRNNSPTH